MTANTSAGLVSREGWRAVLNAVEDTLSAHLVHLPGGHHTWIQLDLAECAFVSGYILLQDGRQRFRLLWAQINALEIVDFHLGFALLLQSTEYQEEIPDVHPHLHAVGIVLAIVVRVLQCDVGLRWVRHRSFSVAGLRQGNKVPALHTWGGRPFDFAQGGSRPPGGPKLHGS